MLLANKRSGASTPNGKENEAHRTLLAFGDAVNRILVDHQAKSYHSPAGNESQILLHTNMEISVFKTLNFCEHPWAYFGDALRKPKLSGAASPGDFGSKLT